MKINQITVSAGRTFNHPYEAYSNFRPEVVISATVDEAENVDSCTRSLQAKAEALVEQHKQNLLENIEHLRESAELNRELANMEQTIASAQERMEKLRRRQTELLALPEANP